jgi:hypothetical protein
VTDQEFLDAFQAFMKHLDGLIVKMNKEFNGHAYYKEVLVEHGPKYAKVVFVSSSKSVHCFIDKTTGGIFKPSSWRSPAKGERANIFKPETYANADVYGSYLYRYR